MHIQYRHEGQKRLPDYRPDEHDQPDEGNDLPDAAEAFLQGTEETGPIQPFALRCGYNLHQIHQDQQSGKHGERHGRQSKISHIPGNKKRAEAKGQGAAGIEDGHGKTGFRSGIKWHHAGDGGMKH